MTGLHEAKANQLGPELEGVNALTNEEAYVSEKVNTDFELLTATSDVYSQLELATIDDIQYVKFRFNITDEITLRLEDFLLMFRLFNMVWYSPLLQHLDICVNQDCQNKPHGAHVRQETCYTMSPYQKMRANAHEHEMRELRRQESLRIASLGGENSD